MSMLKETDHATIKTKKSVVYCSGRIVIRFRQFFSKTVILLTGSLNCGFQNSVCKPYASRFWMRSIPLSGFTRVYTIIIVIVVEVYFFVRTQHNMAGIGTDNILLLYMHRECTTTRSCPPTRRIHGPRAGRRFCVRERSDDEGVEKLR